MNKIKMESCQNVWDIFFDINQIPRPSGQEAKFREYILKKAASLNFKTNVDKVGNVVVYVPASSGYENHPAVMIQNHMDMVCDATPEKSKTMDFSRDPIEVYVENGWLKARETTLGADNGLGCALALALMDEKNLKHPALELLFTIDEETGLNGAPQIEKHMFQAKNIINLDTEDWGNVYIGCAGGFKYEYKSALKHEAISSDEMELEIALAGLCGGHSGIDIHRQRGNANKLLANFLSELKQKIDFRLSTFQGGRAHNIITRDAIAKVVVSKKNADALTFAANFAKEWETKLKSFLPKEDRAFSLSVKAISESKAAMTKEQTQMVIDALVLIPNGPRSFALELPVPEKIVSLSSNLGLTRISHDQLHILVSVRFFDRKQASVFENQLQALGRSFDFEVSHGDGYVSWKPDFNSKLLKQVQKVYKEKFGSEIVTTAVHAGLECAILKDRLGADVDVISLGPTIRGAHSPTESVEIGTVQSVWVLLCGLLEQL